MARVIRESPLEIYVKQWLKANTVKRKAGFDLLRKASVYIDEKIATDCCDPDNPVINLYTNKESVFVRDVYTILFGMSRNGNIQSLTRTRDAILNYITDPCCFANSILFDITSGPTGTVHSAANPYTISVDFTTSGLYTIDISFVQLYVNGVLVGSLSASHGTVTGHIVNAVGSVVHTYYLVANSIDGTAKAQSVTTTFTLTNP